MEGHVERCRAESSKLEGTSFRHGSDVLHGRPRGDDLHDTSSSACEAERRFSAHRRLIVTVFCHWGNATCGDTAVEGRQVTMNALSGQGRVLLPGQLACVVDRWHAPLWRRWRHGPQSRTCTVTVACTGTCTCAQARGTHTQTGTLSSTLEHRWAHRQATRPNR